MARTALSILVVFASSLAAWGSWPWKAQVTRPVLLSDLSRANLVLLATIEEVEACSGVCSGFAAVYQTVRYEVDEVLAGSWSGDTILVGHFASPTTLMPECCLDEHVFTVGTRVLLPLDSNPVQDQFDAKAVSPGVPAPTDALIGWVRNLLACDASQVDHGTRQAAIDEWSQRSGKRGTRVSAGGRAIDWRYYLSNAYLRQIGGTDYTIGPVAPSPTGEQLTVEIDMDRWKHTLVVRAGSSCVPRLLPLSKGAVWLGDNTLAYLQGSEWPWNTVTIHNLKSNHTRTITTQGDIETLRTGPHVVICETVDGQVERIPTEGGGGQAPSN